MSSFFLQLNARSILGIVFITFLILCQSKNALATSVMELKDHQFDFLKSGNWLVQFYSPSCPHCSRFAMDYEKFAETVEHVVPELKVAKVNIAENPGLAARFLILRVPTVYYIRNHKVYQVPDFNIPSLSEFIERTWKGEKPWNVWWSPFSYFGTFLAGFGRVSKFVQTSKYGFVFWTLPFVVGVGGIYLYAAARNEANALSEAQSPSSGKHTRPSRSKKQD